MTKVREFDTAKAGFTLKIDAEVYAEYLRQMRDEVIRKLSVS